MKRLLMYSGLLLILILGCRVNTTVQKPYAEQARKATESKPKQTSYLIPSILFLENRVENCDSAIVFMKNIVIPGNTPWQEFTIRGESKQFLKTFKKDGKIRVQTNQRFYLSLDCLIGKKIEVALDIFVKPKYHKDILAKLNATSRSYILAEGFCSFHLVVKNGIITKAKYNFIKMSH